MGAAAELRKQIESALAERIPAALSPRPLRSPELISCGVAEIDALLGGGLPLGAIVELTPPQHPNRAPGEPVVGSLGKNSRRSGDPVAAGSSGRTTLALSTLAGLTRRGHCCAYVDACDTLDPLSAAALGVELRRLLWVRPPEQNPVKKMKNPKVPHISPSLGDLGRTRSAQSNPYQRLESALRATDLLLNAGSWGAVVLDLAGLPAAQARRVPLATWYRFRLQAEKSRALLLLLTPIACAKSGAPGEPSAGSPGLSCAAVSLQSEEARAEWRRAAENGPPLLAELRHRMSLARRRAANPVPPNSIPKKPPAKVRQSCGADQTWWTSVPAWPG